jgi:hypothetical protein
MGDASTTVAAAADRALHPMDMSRDPSQGLEVDVDEDGLTVVSLPGRCRRVERERTSPAALQAWGAT